MNIKDFLSPIKTKEIIHLLAPKELEEQKEELKRCFLKNSSCQKNGFYFSKRIVLCA